MKTGVTLPITPSISHSSSHPLPPQPMLIRPGFTSFVLSSNIDQGGVGGISAQKRELVCHSCDCCKSKTRIFSTILSMIVNTGHCLSNRRETGTQTGQNRKTQKPHWIIKPKNRYYFLRKPDAKKKNPQTATNTKTDKPKSFGTKTDLENSQNRKSKNPNVPLLLGQSLKQNCVESSQKRIVNRSSLNLTCV